MWKTSPFMFVLLVSLLLVARAEPDEENEDYEEEEVVVVKKKYDGVPLHKRPMDFNFRALPFFSMFIKRPDDNGPSKLGFQVFPELSKGGLLNLSHKWFKR